MPSECRKRYPRPGSGRRKIVYKPCYAAQHGGIARSPFECLFSKIDQEFGVETCRQAFEAQGSHLPVAIASGPPHEIELARSTVTKRLTQLDKQRGIGTCRSSECRIECTCFISHSGKVTTSG